MHFWNWIQAKMYAHLIKRWEYVTISFYFNNFSLKFAVTYGSITSVRLLRPFLLGLSQEVLWDTPSSSSLAASAQECGQKSCFKASVWGQITRARYLRLALSQLVFLSNTFFVLVLGQQKKPVKWSSKMLVVHWLLKKNKKKKIKPHACWKPGKPPRRRWL